VLWPWWVVLCCEDEPGGLWASLPVTLLCQILTTNTSSLLCEHHGRLLLFIYLFLPSFFHRLISEVPWPIVTKLCSMVDGDPGL